LAEEELTVKQLLDGWLCVRILHQLFGSGEKEDLIQRLMLILGKVEPGGLAECLVCSVPEVREAAARLLNKEETDGNVTESNSPHTSGAIQAALG